MQRVLEAPFMHVVIAELEQRPADVEEPQMTLLDAQGVA
jgi:hypothetical protein